jgi:SprT protein
MKFIGNFDPDFKSKIQDCHSKAMQALKDKNLNFSDEMIHVSFNNRMRSTAGRAWVIKQKIELNFRLLSENLSELETTYLHELAHIVAQALYGNRERGHGYLWAGIMATFGLPPERCHTLETKHLRRKRTRYIYSCSGCAQTTSNHQFNLTPQKHKNGNRYRCTSCLTPISFTGQVAFI